MNNQSLQSSAVQLKTNDQLTFGKDTIIYAFESFSHDSDNTIIYPSMIHDEKISLVNENRYQKPKINHLKGKNYNS